ncbi:MAG: hypothetical protein IJK71_00645 [Clostridia bacterium]|nr:hypothetical protein [Clostridia bacterium]
MKKKCLITGIVALIVVIAAVVLLLQNNKENSEFGNLDYELHKGSVSTAVPSTEEKGHSEEKTEAVSTEVLSAEESNQSAISNEAVNTEVPAAEDNKEGTVKETAEAEEKDQPFLVQITDDDPSIAYVLVRMPNPIGLLPLPLEGEYSKTIRTKLADGSEYINVLHITPNGFNMVDANCEGHDCMGQGEVTLENRENRIMWNMIICLPHQLSAELITREEALQMLAQ